MRTRVSLSMLCISLFAGDTWLGITTTLTRT